MQPKQNILFPSDHVDVLVAPQFYVSNFHSDWCFRLKNVFRYASAMLPFQFQFIPVPPLTHKYQLKTCTESVRAASEVLWRQRHCCRP